MNEFMATLSFSALPLVLIIAFSLVLPGMGAILTLRNEIMLSLALPSAANAAMALGLLCGINSERRALLYGFATTITLGVIVASLSGKNGARIHELRLGGVFVAGQMLSLLFASMSPSVHAHIGHLFNGEVLAVGKMETAVITVGCAALLFAGFLRRKSLYSWCADEDFFRAGTTAYRTFMAATYTVIAATITLGVSTVGALLVTALMVLPPLMADGGKGGIDRFAIMVALIGFSGSVAGFWGALIFDLPPAVCAAAGVGAAGVAFRIVTISVQGNRT